MSSLPMRQGIVVAIFGSDDEGGGRARPSLRRTLSADMSSKKWLAQNGFGSSSSSSPMKKIASSKELSLCSIPDSYTSSEEDGDEEERESVWASIQREQRNNKQLDIWSSVTSQNKAADKSLPPPYVHPLVKRSASSLSAKSLQICTESLGSETGSDGFASSDSESEKSDSEADSEKSTEEQRQEVEVEEEEYTAVKFTYSSGKKSSVAVTAARPAFPPPLPSLSSRRGEDGAPTLRMRTHRDNGRLVMEAVSVPASEKNFAAQRSAGRLVLNFARSDREIVAAGSEDELEEQFSSETEMEIEDEEEEEEVPEEEIMMKKEIEGIESRFINFHRLALMANKPIALPNRRTPKYMEEEQSYVKPSHVAAVAKSLPPLPRGPVRRLIPPPAEAKVSTAAAASFNHYDYFWRTKINDSNDNKPASFKNPTTENDKREFVVSIGNGNYIPFSYCKEPRRSLLCEPRCIATS